MGAGYSIRARGNAAAEIFIYEDVGASFFGGVTAKDFAADLKKLGSVETINLHINSPGGDVFDGVAIYRQLADHKAKIVVHIDGVAASIASVIAMAGDEIHISESGFVMIHNASAVAIGDAGEMRRLADLLDTVSGTIADVYAARTGKNRDEIRTLMDAETWMTGKEALEMGFATSVVANLKVAARAIDPATHKFKNIPDLLMGRPDYDAAHSRLAEMRARLQQHKLRNG
jgi:ATP-dependent protease ClpP protease subunit